MFKEEIKPIKHKAEKAKYLYNIGKMSREEAKEEIGPYIELFNEKAKSIAKKYNQKPKTISYVTYLR
jgi:hypothetical protein